MKTFYRILLVLSYALEILLLFTLQETPGLLPEILGARPVLVFPAVLCIAMLEREKTALLFGVLGGLLCDFGFSGTLGFHALLYGMLCFFVSLLAQKYMRVTLVTALLTGFWGMGICTLLEWFCLYFFTYSSPGYVLLRRFVPKLLYSLIFVPLCYLLNHGLYQTIGEQGDS